MTDSLLESLKALLQKAPDIVSRTTWDAWASETAIRAAQVQLYHDYMDGQHRAKLTDGMMKLLRLEGTTAVGDISPFNLNHMDNIVQKLVDRLEVTAIETDTEAGKQWVQSLLDANRFDGLQLSVHDGACGDGDGFLMVAPPTEDNDLPTFTHEEAYDGVEGMILVYGADGKTPAVAVKTWRESVSENGKLSAQSRVNVYWPDRVEKYVTANGGALQEYRDEPSDVWPYPWRDAAGRPLGVPVFHFPNRSRKHARFGLSEIADAIPVQDAINRVMTSTIMSAELTAFQIRIARGWIPPADISPGMWIPIVPKVNGAVPGQFSDSQLEWLKTVTAETLETADLSPYLEVQKFLIDQMYEITRTPRAAAADSSSSGESLKQREVDLVGKVKRCQISFGLVWEAAVMYAAKLQNVYGKAKAPAFTKTTAKWRSPELRNNAEIVANAKIVADFVDERTMLETLAPVYGWDAEKIEAIMAAKKGEQTQRLSALGVGGALPGFGGAQPLDAGAGQADGGNDALAADIVSVPVSANGAVNGIRAAA